MKILFSLVSSVIFNWTLRAVGSQGWPLLGFEGMEKTWKCWVDTLKCEDEAKGHDWEPKGHRLEDQ